MIPRHPTGQVDVVIRLLIWFACVAVMVIVMGALFGAATGAGMMNSQVTDTELRPFQLQTPIFAEPRCLA
jgi:hypothetical protein